MTCRVVGIGHAGIDHIAMVDRYPEIESDVELAGLSIQGTGPVATAMVTIAKFGVQTAFLGKVSDDDFGRFIVRGLEGVGVDTRGLVIENGRISPYRFLIVERERHRHTVLRTDGNVSPMRPDDLDLSLLDGAELLVLDGFHVEAQVRAAEEARRRGIRVVLDAGGIHEGMGDLVPLTDVLIASERYASDVAPRGEVEDSVIELGRMGPQVVVVTLGEEGSIGLEGDKMVRQPSLTVHVVDTTGAGAAFLGACCYGLLQKWSLERCMQIASAAASLSCRELGSRAGLPSLDEVMQEL